MRLDRLGLTRYGIFSDRLIDFREPVQGEPDLHVIYGPNESGKSTALAGFLDLLFAFQHRSPYGFGHGYDAMQVEADLNIGGATRHFVRIRRRQGSLLDKSGRPVSDDSITNAMGGMNRETYKAMFSLDDDTLEAGGEEILRSEGDLGRLLFATGAGLVELSKTLNRLRDTAQGFHRTRSRSTELHGLRARLEELEQEKRNLDTAASAYARLVAERDTAGAAYDETIALRARLETERQEALRCIEGLRRLADIHPLRAELADLETLPEAPGVWFTQIGDLIADEPRLNERLKGLRDQERKLSDEKEGLVLDNAILELEDHLGQLDMSRARYVTAEEDLPRRRASLAEHRGTIAAIIRRLNKAPGTDPGTLVIPAGTTGVLNELIERRSGIEERLKASAEEMETAKLAVDAAATALETVSRGEDADDVAFQRLNHAIESTRSDDFSTRLTLHTEQGNRLTADLEAQLTQLHPWSGDAEGLARVCVPERDELTDWESVLDEAQRDIERIGRDKAKLLAERRRLSELIDRRATETGVTGDEEAERLRTLRDQAWTRHRAALDNESADKFKDRLDEDDSATAGRIAHATALAELRQAAEALRNLEAEVEGSEAELALARDRQQGVLARIASTVAVMSRTGADNLPPDIALPKLMGWMQRRAEVLDTLARIGRENVEIDRARRSANRHRERLANALTAVGLSREPAVNLEELIDAAREAVALDTERRAAWTAARQRLDRGNAELERRKADTRRAGEDDRAWRQDWTAALSSCWLAEADPAPSTSAVRRILEDTAILDSTLAKHDEMSDRVRLMELDRVAYAEEVKSLIQRLGGGFDPDHPVAQGDGLRARLATAIANRATREGLEQKIGVVSEDIAGVENNLAELQAVATEMYKAFRVDSLRAVDERLQKVTRRETLRKDLSKRETGLIEAMKAPSLDAARAALTDANPADLERQIAEIEARLADASTRTQELYHGLQTAKESINAIGGDVAVARLEAERRTCLLDIQDRARDYVRTRIGIEAADRALRAYRDEHRSTMMERASQAFRTISRGAYSRLDAQLTDKGEVLIGIAAGGGTKIASQMSKGARFQLYLALRVAGYREFVDLHGPVPFIADDILETSDDFRAKEAFRLFAEMAKVGQVIYLGHHRHLCGIAQDVCPSVTIHELPDPVETTVED